VTPLQTYVSVITPSSFFFCKIESELSAVDNNQSEAMGNCFEGTSGGGRGGGISNDSAIGGKKDADNVSVHQGILRELNIDVYKKYTEHEVLGQGSMGHVARVQVKEGKEGGSAFNSKHSKKAFGTQSSSNLSERRREKVDYALKSIQLERVSPMFLDELKNEIDILKAMDHPNIVKAHEVYSHKRQIYLILELCDGGDLYTKLPYTEKHAGLIVGKLCSAIKYMHDHGIVHRDLKFENIMFENKGEDAEIKVIDFGLSKKFLDKKIGVMHEGVGTLYSMSPQVLQGVYTSQADMWSVGVITYMLLSSHRPFYHKRRKVMIDRIMRVDYTFEKDYWQSISSEAKDMIDQLLVMDPKKRNNADKALKHTWLSNEFNLSDRMADQTTADSVQDNLIHYKDTSALKKIALNVIAHKSSSSEILELRKLFDQYDTANNGVISFEEFKAALEKSNYPQEQVEEIFKSIDVNSTGNINYTEFVAATLEINGHIEEERVAEAFDRLDSDDSGYISRENLRQFLGKRASSAAIDDILKAGDLDGDGKISWEEFHTMFRQNAEKMQSQMHTMDSTVSDSDVGLVGLDAKIPGGKYDSEVRNLS